MARQWMFNGEAASFDVKKTDDKVVVRVENTDYDYQVAESLPGQLNLVGKKRYRIHVARSGEKVWVHANGNVFELMPAVSLSELADHEHANMNSVHAPMPGALIQILVKPGESVERDQVVAIVEAMKMEHNLRAPRAGKVKTIIGSVGLLVDSGAAVVVLETEK
jgi:3-methylcrotonyl-CoA carboxylase alpha subunit